MIRAPFRFSIHDNDSFMFASAPHCPTCTRVLDPTWIDPDFTPAKKQFDLSTTYDGCAIASDAFVELCSDIDGVRFVPLACAPGFAVMRVERIVRVDPLANKTRFGEICADCGYPRFVVSPGPLYLAEGETVPNGLSRTDLGYGDTADFGPRQPNHLGPVIVSDAATAHVLNSSRLRGVHLFPP